VQKTGSFHLPLIFVGVTGMFAIASYVLIVGPIRRLTVEDLGGDGGMAAKPI
jgi:hypothetical protein